jgi:hypothetical protein
MFYNLDRFKRYLRYINTFFGFLERNHTFIGFDVEVGPPLSICIETFFTLADNFQQQLHRRRLRRINWIIAVLVSNSASLGEQSSRAQIVQRWLGNDDVAILDLRGAGRPHASRRDLQRR